MNKSIYTDFIFTINSFNTKIIKGIDRNLFVHGISFTEYTIMRALYNVPTKTMRRIELANEVGLSASGVTRLLAPMEKNKIIEKEVNARDARVSLVKLSKTGKILFDEATVSFDYSVKTISEKLSENQLNKIVEYSNKLL
jgi:DNA-binding MarR family transcriptional regulator